MINILEILMIVTTFMYSYLMLYCKRSGLIFGLIASSITSYILILDGVYIQAILYWIYAGIYCYSFFSWGKEDSLKISNISNRGIIISVIYVLVFTICIGYSFENLKTVYPYLDAFSSACSMTAVFLLSKKIIENSYVFILSNIVSIVICYMTYDYIMLITFIIYMVFNIIRIFTWKRIKEKER